jgi:L-alanine-DL-glutamate epimerase-like enolase superfamily enzyme
VRASGSTIACVRAFAVDLPLADGLYRMSGGRGGDQLETVVVAVEASDGTVGWGEVSALGTYAPAFAGGARAALPLLAPALLGLDPSHAAVVNARLDETLNGHPYAKSGLDMACYDLAARLAGVRVCDLLGGPFGGALEVYRAISLAEPEAMAEQARRFAEAGYRRLQVKVGEDPATDVERVRAVRQSVGPGVVLFADANGGWTTRDARLFLARLEDEAGIVLEQPCLTSAECARLRSSCRWPIVLDESIDSLEAFLHARELGGADGITIKLSRVGGLTRARTIRDAAVALRVPVTVEDTGGAEIDTAAIVHLFASTPVPFRIHTYPFHEIVAGPFAAGMPAVRGGQLELPEGPGLGVEPDLSALGDPIFETAQP